LAGILAHSRRRFGVKAASELRRRIFDRLANVAALPLSGRVPPELASLGDERLREVVLAPHRVFYLVQLPMPILVFAIADGRRALDEILIRRAVALPGLP
jgi:plasmid stabilization system protein ParE